MIGVLARLHEVSFEDEIAKLPVGDEGDVHRRPHLGLIGALLVQLQRPILAFTRKLPGRGLGEDKLLERFAFLESLLEGELIAGGHNGGDSHIGAPRVGRHQTHGHDIQAGETFGERVHLV